MIYFAQEEPDGNIKIGFTDGDPAERVRSLQTGCSATLVLLAVGEGTQADEKDLHRKLKRFRVRGEWFRPAPEVLALVTEYVERGFVPPAGKRAPRETAEWVLARHLIGMLRDHGADALSLRGPAPVEAESVKGLARDFCTGGGNLEGLYRIFWTVVGWAQSHFSRREAGLVEANLIWRFDGAGGWWA